MDFFYIEDLVKLINYFINNKFFPKDINAVYKSKYHLSEIAGIINNLSDYKVDIIINEPGFSKSYIGKPLITEIIPLKFKGIEDSIKEIYNKLK
jgi:GDP-L-fucose synthase